jgi:hypothetical protein
LNDDDQELGERDNAEPSDFPPGDRKIHTQSYDLSLNTLKEQWDDKTLIIPDFQREYVWDNAKASRLIESLLLNIPIPVLFFSETPAAHYEIVDGHQRVFSVVRYLDNQFPLSGLRIQEELKGLRFHKLPEREQRFLRTRTMRAIVINVDSSPTMKFEVFERLNTGGLALNAQEIRNAISSGELNNLLRELEATKAFMNCLGVRKPRKRMVDRELVLRFFALRDRLPSYRTPLVRFLNDYMRDNRNPDPSWLDDHRRMFTDTMEVISQVLGPSAFRVTDADGTPTERVINRAVFEAQSTVFSIADRERTLERREELRRGLGALFGDETFDDSIRFATGDRARTLSRIRDVAEVFESAGVSVDLTLLGEVNFPSRAGA